jgi:hypothetical protein
LLDVDVIEALLVLDLFDKVLAEEDFVDDSLTEDELVTNFLLEEVLLELDLLTELDEYFELVF